MEKDSSVFSFYSRRPMEVRVSGPGGAAWAKYPREPLGWADIRLRWKSQPGRRVKTADFTIVAIAELRSEIAIDRNMIENHPEDPSYRAALADGESRLARLLASETGMERRGAEHCLFIPKEMATRADAEAEMTRWFRRNGENRPIRYRWEKADWFPVPVTLR
ncbi:MAG: hypothetical protein EPO35_08885 [Acidobacteria bacterium]|nr:MAG: hypothetical protein EPO35_08885 [Acidobacteriota bacterium]